MIDIRVTGDKRLVKALKRLEGPAQKKAVRKGLRAAAKPIQQAAIRLAPRGEEGRLKKIVIRALRRSRRFFGVRVMTTDDPTGVDRSVAHHVELGTKNRPATPFLRPALEANRARSLQTLGARIWDELRKVKA